MRLSAVWMEEKQEKPPVTAAAEPSTFNPYHHHLQKLRRVLMLFEPDVSGKGLGTRD